MGTCGAAANRPDCDGLDVLNEEAKNQKYARTSAVISMYTTRGTFNVYVYNANVK